MLERGPLGELWLAIYNYRGAPVHLWDFASLGGAFWQGNLRAGFVVEVAARAAYADAFLAHLCDGWIADGVNHEHVRTVTYASRLPDAARRPCSARLRPRGPPTERCCRRSVIRRQDCRVLLQ